MDKEKIDYLPWNASSTDTCKSKWIQYQVQRHFLQKAVPDAISVLPCALPTPEDDVSLWNSQCHSDGSCPILSYIPVSCLFHYESLIFWKYRPYPTGSALEWKRNQWLIYTSPLSLFFFFNTPTETLWGSMALLSSIPATSTWLFKNQYSNIAISVIDFYEVNTVSLHPSRPSLSKHFSVGECFDPELVSCPRERLQYLILEESLAVLQMVPLQNRRSVKLCQWRRGSRRRRICHDVSCLKIMLMSIQYRIFTIWGFFFPFPLSPLLPVKWSKVTYWKRCFRFRR